MTDFSALESRLRAALEGIAAGLSAGASSAPAAGAREGDLAALRAALAAESEKVAALTAKLNAAKDKAPAGGAAKGKLEALTAQLDVQGLEMQRLRKANALLREQLRALTEAAVAGGEGASGAQINKALAVEVEALRAERAAESAELDAILAALEPLVEEGGLPNA